MSKFRYPKVLALSEEDMKLLEEVQKHTKKTIIQIFRDGLKANDKA